MPELENSGERYVASLDEPVISYEHWHRYLVAAEFVKNQAVLDIACGEGYGSRLLAQQAKSVLGVDIDNRTIEYAREHYPFPNLTFQTGSVDAIPVEGKKVFDVIVSFETIEHVDETKQIKFLKEVKRLLKPGGLFLVSTPNKATYSDLPKYQNPFHVKEFYADEFKVFLQGYFKKNFILNQKVYAVSYLWQEKDAKRRIREYGLQFTPEGFRPSQEPKSPVYLLAACSDRTLPKSESSLLVDLSARLFERQAEFIAVLERQAEHLKIVGEALREKEKLQAELAEVLERQARDLKITGEALAQKDARIAELEEKILQKEREYRNLKERS